MSANTANTTNPDPLSAAQLILRLREFVTGYPLYRKMDVILDKPVHGLDFPTAISMPCGHALCVGEPATTWQFIGKEQMFPGEVLTYRCVHCENVTQTTWVMSHGSQPAHAPLPPSSPAAGRVVGKLLGYRAFRLQKIGQWPPWSIEPSKEVSRALDPDNLALYKNALVCMSQSYGLASLAYFRRVIENAVGTLLDLVEEAAKEDGDAAALEAVGKARASKIADEKLRLIVDFVPLSLRPGGVNPLAKLYDDYSRGIHALSDEECLGIATDLRDTLEYVFGNIRDKLQQAKAYRAKITSEKT